MDYWFIRVSPGGAQRVAGGSTRLQEDGIDLGDGTEPRYQDSNTIFYKRHSDGAFMRYTRGVGSELIREEGFNFYEVAPDGRWVGYRPDPPRLIWWNKVPWVGWNIGAISNTRWAARYHENMSLWAGTGNGLDGTLIDRRPCTDVRLLDDILVWRTEGDIFGQRRHQGEIENWSIEGEDHFWPVPVWVGSKLYILTHTQNRLLLYEAKKNQTHGVVVNTGISDFPDAGATDDKRIRIVWTDKGLKHERIINLAEQPLVDLRTPTEVTVEDTTGSAIDPLAYTFGELAQRDGDHYICIYVNLERKRWYEIKFGNPDSWEAFAWDEERIWIHEDRSQSEPRYNPPWNYSFTEDTWLLRPMKPRTDIIRHDNNEWIRFNPLTNKIIDRGPLRFDSWISRVYLSYPFGGNVGTRAAFALDVRAKNQDHLERHIFAVGVGRCIFQVVHAASDQVQFQTKFVTTGGPRLTPTVGGRDSNPWPPAKKLVGMTITDFQSVVDSPRSRAIANPNPGEEWSETISWWYKPVTSSEWIRQDEPRDPRKDNDHTFRFPGPGRYHIQLTWESGQTRKERIVTVR